MQNYRLHHQPVAVQQLDECVPPWETPCILKLSLQYQPEFYAAKPRVLPAVVFYFFHYYRLKRQRLKIIVIAALVIRLPTITKQSAQRAETCARLRFSEQTYCLVPAFFLIGMLKFASATSIIVSKALERSFSISSAS